MVKIISEPAEDFIATTRDVALCEAIAATLGEMGYLATAETYTLEDTGCEAAVVVVSIPRPAIPKGMWYPETETWSRINPDEPLPPTATAESIATMIARQIRTRAIRAEHFSDDDEAREEAARLGRAVEVEMLARKLPPAQAARLRAAFRRQTEEDGWPDGD